MMALKKVYAAIAAVTAELATSGIAKARSLRGPTGDLLFCVTIRAAFDFVSAEDGSKHVIETYGEAMDQGDKATAKAMSAAYKTAAIQTFCIPTSGDNDADGSTHKPKAIPEAELTPDQGWEAWAEDFRSVANACLTEEALVRHQTRYRDRLRTLSRTQPGLYAEVGATIRERKAAVIPTVPQKEAA